MGDSRTLELVHREPALKIVTNDGREQNLFTDFRGVTVTASRSRHGRLITAGWEGRTLVVEATDNDGTRVVREFSLGEGGRTLTVTARASGPMQDEPVAYRQVYSRAQVRHH